MIVIISCNHEIGGKVTQLKISNSKAIEKIKLLCPIRNLFLPLHLAQIDRKMEKAKTA